MGIDSVGDVRRRYGSKLDNDEAKELVGMVGDKSLLRKIADADSFEVTNKAKKTLLNAANGHRGRRDDDAPSGGRGSARCGPNSIPFGDVCLFD